MAYNDESLIKGIQQELLRVKLVFLNDYNINKELGMISEEETKRRTNYVIKNLSNYKVHLKNKTVELCRALLAFCDPGLKLHEHEEYFALSNLELEIDSQKVNKLMFQLSELPELLSDHSLWGDYYIFFRSLGHSLMSFFLIESLSSIDSIGEKYLAFKKVAMKIENDEVKRWFQKPVDNKIPTEYKFDTMFCHHLFEDMKQLVSIEDFGFDDDGFVDVIRNHLLNCPDHIFDEEHTKNHPDYFNFEEIDDEEMKDRFFLNNKFGNISITSLKKKKKYDDDDREVYKLPIELLIFRSNYFMEQVIRNNINNKKDQEEEEEELFIIRELNEIQVKYFVDYLYDSEFSKDKHSRIGDCVHLIRFAITWDESELLKDLMRHVKKLITSKKDIQNTVEIIGHLFSYDFDRKKMDQALRKVLGVHLDDNNLFVKIEDDDGILYYRHEINDEKTIGEWLRCYLYETFHQYGTKEEELDLWIKTSHHVRRKWREEKLKLTEMRRKLGGMEKKVKEQQLLIEKNEMKILMNLSKIESLQSV